MKTLFTRTLSGLVALALIGSLAACGGGTSIGPDNRPDDAPSDTQIDANENPGTSDAGDGSAEAVSAEGEIRFSWWGGDSRHNATMEAIDAFMAQNPDIVVKAEYGAWDGWTEKCATQLSGGTAPDLMQTNWNWLYQFSSDGSRFVDLNEYSSIISLNNYSDSILEEGMVAGKLQGLPIGITGKAFFWNGKTFAEAGLEVPTSFEEIINAGQVFETELGEDYYPLGMYEYERLIMMMYYLQSKYGKDWAVDNQLNYSVDEIQDGFEWLNMLEERHVLPSIAMIRGDGANVLEKNTKWITGRYAGFYEWDSAQNKLAEALEDSSGFVLGEFPTDLGPNSAGLTKVNMCYSITETSQNKEAAAQLMEFLTSDPEGVSLIATERGMLANSAANEILVAEGKLEGLTYEANQAVMKVANFSFDPNFENSALKDDTGIYYEVIAQLSAGTDPATLAQYFVDEVNEVYAKNSY